MSRACKLAPAILSQELADAYQDGRLVPPETDEEKWVSMCLIMSRACSHELVRHGDFTAISQRSTRYVDESEATYHTHPVLQSYLIDCGMDTDESRRITGRMMSAETAATLAYSDMAKVLEKFLISRGVDKRTSKKQARGAARMYLGHNTETEMIFSASVAEWKHILDMRGAADADAEIRELACKAFDCLRLCRYGAAFQCFEKVPSPDGIGELVIRKAA